MHPVPVGLFGFCLRWDPSGRGSRRLCSPLCGFAEAQLSATSMHPVPVGLFGFCLRWDPFREG
jgi:hypothetical protein